MSTYTTSRTFNATAAELWKALTEKELMKQWYFDLAEFKPEKGFVFTFIGGPEDGPQYQHRCEITEVIHQRKLSYTWQYVGYPGVSLLTFELMEQGDQTLLSVTHSGIENFPAEVKDFAFQNFEAGWNFIINTSLVNFIQKYIP